MKRILYILSLLIVARTANAQITITAADMPVAGDTLRYSFAAAAGSGIVLTDTGAGVAWNYAFTPIRQAVDTYQTAFAVNPTFALTIGLTAYGYKVADSSPIPIPLPGAPSIQNIYTFFEKKTGPARYQAKAFAANIGGLPTPINYTNPDVWYFFPLDYQNNDSANYKLNITLPGFGSIKQVGTRKSRVDAWGTITTPYYTTPVNCLRVRSVIHEIDSVQLTGLPIPIGFPRNTVEYKWLVNGEHYPALWVTTTIPGPGGPETINSVRYRDNPLPDTTIIIDNHVPVISNDIVTIKAYPNPATTGLVTVDVPGDWQTYTIEVYDMQSKEVATFSNTHLLDIHSLPAGQYIARITSGTNVGYAQIVK